MRSVFPPNRPARCPVCNPSDPVLALVLALGLALVCAVRPAVAGPYTDPGHSATAVAAWASSVDALARGPLDLANPAGGFASFGAPTNALGPATGDPAHVVSLGDGGWLTTHFALPIHNGPGDDVVVFENGFLASDGQFAELAYVEVATNGIDFARFATTTLVDFPVGSFEPLDPTDYHGLAGRHEIGLGTGFDLADLAGDPLVASGAVDLLNVRFVRILDVVGDGSRLDAHASPIFDPYPTPFPTGGFDLEAVGALAVPEPQPAAGLAVTLGGFALLVCRRRLGRSSTSRRPASARHLPGKSARPSAASLLALGGFVALGASPATALRASFDDLGLAPDTFENGANLAGGFTSGGIFFENDYTAAFDVFSGFAASTKSDATTPGFGNQFSPIPGSGAGGSASFGVYYATGSIRFPEPTIVRGASFTNTTYAALSMRDGDAFSKRFGGLTGSDPDYFRLTIEGLDDGGFPTGTQELLLADYRFADDALDFILDEWVFLDLTGLGMVRSLRFAFESSDVGTFGINTPTYFAIDDLETIPEPGSALLLGLGLAVLARSRAGATRR